MLPGFTAPSSLGKSKGSYATTSMSGAVGFSPYPSMVNYAFDTSSTLSISPFALSSGCAAGTVCCDFDPESANVSEAVARMRVIIARMVPLGPGPVTNALM